MKKTIQMVKINNDVSLFIVDFDEETETMKFRTTEIPEYLQEEKVKISQDMVYTNLYHFPMAYLTNFVVENMN